MRVPEEVAELPSEIDQPIVSVVPRLHLKGRIKEFEGGRISYHISPVSPGSRLVLTILTYPHLSLVPSVVHPSL